VLRIPCAPGLMDIVAWDFYYRINTFGVSNSSTALA